jgi:hypothetical protein
MKNKSVLILRKCSYNGHSRNNFYYGCAGEIAKAPKWNKQPYCGDGLHGLKWGTGNWDLLEGDDWLVIEAKEEHVVEIDKDKCKFKQGKILYRGDTSGLHHFAKFLARDSRSAYEWAKQIGDHEIMRKRIRKNNYAYEWAKKIGDHEIMRDRINESHYAYCWALYIGDRKIMRDRVTDSDDAYYWAKDIGDREIMRDRVTESQWAYKWARDIGDRDIMIHLVTGIHLDRWSKNIGGIEITKNGSLIKTLS